MKIVGAAMSVALALLSLQVLTAQSKPQTFKGYLVDVMCATHHAGTWRAPQRFNRASTITPAIVQVQ
jgi:hypothetical protein